MSYDQYQTVFALSSLANWVSRRHGVASALQADYQRVLHATLGSAPAQATIGAWDVVWGPQIWQAKDSNRSDNAMFVAKSSNVNGIDGDVYVVAICATNPYSFYDWLVEDFDVASVVKFAKYDPLAPTPPVAAGKLILPETPVISMGAALGVWHLLNMVSPASAAAPGTTLDTFLKTAAETGATVIFAGHSLGGALSPTMATWLKSTQRLDGCKAVYCYPTAGATPGNAAFADLYAATLPPSAIGEKPYQAWNHDLWNTLDVVPHAWVLKMLGEIRHIYGNGPILGVEAFVFLATFNALASGVSYRQITNQSLQGTLSGSAPKSTLEFLKQMAIQHGTAYETLIGEWLTPVVPLGYALQSAEVDAEALLQAQAARLDAASEGVRALRAEGRAVVAADA
ncbi:lipase family protein [Xanthomonas indica]|uniref:Lipase family protein n=1 Tax=Xanthomonas indica TaxID=2912242 RepID=A0AAU8I647_9XANT|nr:lipase family protein [Xanthomonas indica]MCI2263493.1 lipase family protein [Xanthomonas indica]